MRAASRVEFCQQLNFGAFLMSNARRHVPMQLLRPITEMLREILATPFPDAVLRERYLPVNFGAALGRLAR